MGDIIEFTTWHKHKSRFFKITTNSINFDVKGRCASVVLARSLDEKCKVWIMLNSNSCQIKLVNKKSKYIDMPNLLNGMHFQRFWVSWTNKYVQIGINADPNPIFKVKADLPTLEYVTFTTFLDIPPVHWRVELPPLIKDNVFKPLENSKLIWVPCQSQLNDDAVIGGYMKESLYIMRAEHARSLTPGAFIPTEGCGVIPWGGQSHEKNVFEVLCGQNYKWVKSEKNNLPIGAFIAGYSEVSHEPLYIGRAIHNGHLVPGKVQLSHKVCYIPVNGIEKACEYYEILTVPEKESQCNTTSIPGKDITSLCMGPMEYSSSEYSSEDDNN